MGAEDVRQLMQQDVIKCFRGAFNICAQKDSVYTAFAFTDESRSMKVKIAVLFVSVCQAVREILLAELLKDFLLVFRLKAAQHKVVLAELRPQAFIKGFSRTEKSIFIFVVVHLILSFHGSNCIHAW